MLRACIDIVHGKTFVSVSADDKKRESDWRCSVGIRQYINITEAQAQLPIEELTKIVLQKDLQSAKTEGM